MLCSVVVVRLKQQRRCDFVLSKSFFISFFFPCRVHATVQPTSSVRPSVRPSESESEYRIFFYSFLFFLVVDSIRGYVCSSVRLSNGPSCLSGEVWKSAFQRLQLGLLVFICKFERMWFMGGGGGGCCKSLLTPSRCYCSTHRVFFRYFIFLMSKKKAHKNIINGHDSNHITCDWPLRTLEDIYI